MHYIIPITIKNVIYNTNSHNSVYYIILIFITVHTYYIKPIAITVRTGTGIA